MNVTAAIFARLKADASVIAALQTYGDGPAVFDDAAPDDFVLADGKMLIVIAAALSNEPDDTLTEMGRLIRQEVRLYARHSGDNAALDALAVHVRKLLHAQPALTVTGGLLTFATASGPVASPTTDPALVGRRVSLRINTEETV